MPKSVTELQNLAQYNSCRVSLSSLTPNARGLITTALTPQAVASAHPHAASLVTDLWLCGISARDSFARRQLDKACHRRSKKKSVHFLQEFPTESTALAMSSRDLTPTLSEVTFQGLFNERPALGCDCSHGPHEQLFLESAQNVLSWAVPCSCTKSRRQDTSKQNINQQETLWRQARWAVTASLSPSSMQSEVLST